jgi:hypothetical protein
LGACILDGEELFAAVYAKTVGLGVGRCASVSRGIRPPCSAATLNRDLVRFDRAARRGKRFDPHRPALDLAWRRS